MTRFPDPPPPRVVALRLVGAPPRGVPLPWGVSGWSDDAGAAVAVCLSRGAGGAPDLERIVSELPARESLAPGTLVVVLGQLAPAVALLGRWIGGAVDVPRALRSTALLAAGYERLGGGVDKAGNDLTWGYC